MSSGMVEGDFLNPEQKKVKQEIMENIIGVLRTTAETTTVKFTNEEFADMLLSCTIMFCRHALVSLIGSAEVEDKVKSRAINDVLATIKKVTLKELGLKATYDH